MKLNKTLMIAALIAGSVFAADVAVRAQDTPANKPAEGTPPPGGPGARGRMNFDTIATQLVLTDDQKTKAKPIFDEMQQKMGELRKDTSLSQEDRRAKMKEIREAATAKLKEVPLTQEQLDKWAKMGQGQRRPAGGTPPATDAKPPQ